MPLLTSAIGNYIYSDGKRYSYFAGNNYLGLADHPDVIEATVRAIRKYGLNFSASRRTTGTADIHLELEKELALFKGKRDAVIYSSGYQGNGILFEILRKNYSAVYLDDLSHPSISKNIPRDVTEVYYYNHLDTGHLEFLLDKNKNQKPLIVTDGIFALTGEIAPIDRIFYLAEKHRALLIVDDAHATGVLGRTGKGTPEYFNLPEKEFLFQTETMSKALGSYGGFIAGTLETTESIREISTAYQASTALPPPVVAASLASLKIIRNNPDLQIHLLSKAKDLRSRISQLGYQTTGDETPIIPVTFQSLAMAKDLSLFLENNGFIVPYINYPVRMEKYILRLTVSVNHTEDQAEELCNLLKKWKEDYGKH